MSHTETLKITPTCVLVSDIWINVLLQTSALVVPYNNKPDLFTSPLGVQSFMIMIIIRGRRSVKI
jgi:hypothetical protein